MSDKIKPAEVSKQLDYDILDARDFSADLLEDVNDHSVAMAIRCINLGATRLACSFLKFNERLEEAGEMSQPLKDEFDDLVERYEQIGR